MSDNNINSPIDMAAAARRQAVEIAGQSRIVDLSPVAAPTYGALVAIGE